MNNLFLILVASLFVAIFISTWLKNRPASKLYSFMNDFKLLKHDTINMVSKAIKANATAVIEGSIPDIHCDGLINRAMSTDEIYQLYTTDRILYNQLVACGYNKNIGLLHGLAMWSSSAKGDKNLESLAVFLECMKKKDWSDKDMFVDFHSPTSKHTRCIEPTSSTKVQS